MSLKPPENDLLSNPRSFSFQSKASHKEEDPNNEFLEQFEEAIAERDQRIETLELQLESKEKDFFEQIKNYEAKIMKFQPISDEKPEILKEMELHNQKLEDLLASCEKVDLKSLISLEKQINHEDFYGIEALKRGFEDRLARISQENLRNSNDLSEKLKKIQTEKDDFLKELKKSKEKETQLKSENNDFKQKNIDLNNKVFELNLNLRNLKEKSDFSKNLSENISKNLLESFTNKLIRPPNNEHLEATNEKALEEKKKNQAFEEEIEKFKEKVLNFEEKNNNLEKNIREKEEITKKMEDLMKTKEKNEEIEKEKKILEEKKKNQAFSEEIEKLKEKVLNFEEKNNDFEKIIIEKEEIIRKMEDLMRNKEENEESLNEIQELKEKILFSEEKNKQKDEEIALVNQKLRENIEKRRLSEVKIKELSEKSLFSEEKVKKFPILEEKLRDLTAKLRVSESKINKIEEKLLESEGKADLYDEILDKFNISQEKINDFTLKINDFTNKVLILEQEKVLLSDGNRLLSEEKSKLLEEKRLLIEQMEKTNKSPSKMKNSLEIDNLKAKCVGFELRNSDFAQQKEGFLVKIRELEEKIHLYQVQFSKIEDFQTKLRQKDSLIERLQQENEQLNDEKEIFLEKRAIESKEKEKIEELETVISQLNVQILRLSIEKSSIMETNQNLSRNFEKNSEKVNIFEEKLRTLCEENAKLTRNMDLKESNLQGILKENKKFKGFEEKINELLEELNAKTDLLNKKNNNIENLNQNILEITEKNRKSKEKSLFLQKAFMKKQAEIVEMKKILKEFAVFFKETVNQTRSSFFSFIESEISRYFFEYQQKNEEKMLIIQRIYDKKESTYRGNYEIQISHLEKDLEGLTKSFKEESYMNEKPQKLNKPQSNMPYFLNSSNSNTNLNNFYNNPNNFNNNPNINLNNSTNFSNLPPNKAEFINYLAKKTSLKPKNSEKSPLFNSQIADINITKTHNNLTPKSLQSNSFYLANNTNFDSSGKRNSREIYNRGSLENTQKEVGDLKKSLNLLHDEHQKLLEMVENKEKNNKNGVNDQFAVKCFEKLFDQLAVSLERESQLRVMAQLIEEKVNRNSFENQNFEEILKKSEEKDQIIKALEIENSQYKALCKELQIQLDFKRAQMKFLTQNNETNNNFVNNNNHIINSFHTNNNTANNNNGNNMNNLRKFVEVKRDYSLTHQHSRNTEENETIPNVNISYQRPNFLTVKSPKTPQKVWANKDLKGTKEKMDGSVKRTEKGKNNNNNNPKWV